MRKKRFTILLIVLMSLLTLSACTAQSDTTAGSTRRSVHVSN